MEDLLKTHSEDVELRLSILEENRQLKMELDDLKREHDEVEAALKSSLLCNHMGYQNAFGTLDVTFTPEDLKKAEKYKLYMKRNFPYLSITYSARPK